MHGLQFCQCHAQLLCIVDEGRRRNRQITLHDADKFHLCRGKRGVGGATLFRVGRRIKVVGAGVSADIKLDADLEQLQRGQQSCRACLGLAVQDSTVLSKPSLLNGEMAMVYQRLKV